MPMPVTLAALVALDWVVLVGYLALVVAIGLIASRKQRDVEDYFLGGRRMPTWAVSLSVLATSLSAATFVGVPQLSYGGDLSYLVLTPGGIVAVLVIAFVFIPAFYRAGTLTIYGYLQQRFGETAQIAVAVMFLIGRLFASGARLFIAAIPVTLLLFGLDGVTGPNLALAVLLLGVIGTAYTAVGGIRAVIWTDVCQIIVVVGVAVLSIALLLRAIPLDVGGIVDLLRSAGDEGASKLRLVNTSSSISQPFTLWTGLFAIVFLNTASYGIDHDLVQRMLTCKSAWRGGASLVAANLIGVPVIALFLVIGLLLFIFYNRPDVMGAAAPTDTLTESHQVFAQYLLAHLPTGVTGLAMAGLFAAAMSSFDSAVSAMAASCHADLVQPLRKRARGGGSGSGAAPVQPAPGGMRASRLAVLGMGALLTGFAILAALQYDPDEQTLIGFALGVMSYAYAGMLGVFLTGLLTRRGSTASVLAALAVGALVVVLLQPGLANTWTRWLLGEPTTIAFPWWMVFGTGSSFLVCLAGAPTRIEQGDRSA
ncbi:MAG: sodium:solute symporter [Phycisphaerales bacterium JB038]